jgi:peptide/nickel transport system ATP-binding protein
MSDKLLEIKDLHLVYKTREEHVFALNGINLELEKGETLGIVGETGAGKTTIALSIMQLLGRTAVITNGSILYDGQELIGASEKVLQKIRGRKISMIFQDPMTSLNPTMTVGAQVEEMIRVHDEENLTDLQIDKKVRSIFKAVEIHHRRRKEFPHNFSGGMKQRVVIAMALACRPELIIADEPTTALDVTVQSQVLRLMNELKERLNTSMIMITHDLGIVAKSCDRVAIMYAGEIIETGKLEDIFNKSASHHPYTSGLFKAIPDLYTKSERLIPILGVASDPTDLPEGCNFYPRCDKCMDICKIKDPMVKQYGKLKIKCHFIDQMYQEGEQHE